jgi:outer membrane receptor protein involved in Fe transport
VKANGFNRQEVYNLYANPFTTPRPRVTFREREQFLLLDERFKDETFIADLVGSVDFGGVELTSVTSYIDRDILVSRDASALTGSVSVDLGFPAAGVLLPSNLRDTTTLETFTQELRLASTGSGPFQWVIGGFYSDVERVYAQSLPTPGYDLFTDQVLGAGTAAGSRIGFNIVDSPFNSFLPYDIKQKAVFGEASYEIGRLTATAGLRYYDFKEVRDIRFGGLFADATNNVGDTTSSDGLNPRFLLSYKAADNITVNAQAAKGFRLGGVNDPLNLPLCTAEDRTTFEPFEGSFSDETLWNYEVGVKSQFGRVTFNAAAFRTEIDDLQVTLDAGTCSSRIVFNVPKAHTQGLEFELSAEPVPNFDLSVSGSIIEAEFDSTLTSGGNVIGGIREGNRLPSVPKFQISASASYGIELGSNGTLARFSASVQHVGSRYTQPGDQENNPRTFVHNLPFGGQPAGSATSLDLKLPDYQLVNLSAGITFPEEFEVIAYVNNVFDENPILSFDRERGGRARLGFQIGQPRTFGVTARKRF